MAADQYSADPGTYGQPDMSNGATDWWLQNAPPQGTDLGGGWTSPSGGSPIPIGGPPPYLGAQPIAGVTGPNGEPIYQHPNGSGAPAPDTTAGGDGTTFGGPVAPYDPANPYPTFTPPPLPDYLQRGFALPSAAELQATPGYMARYQQGLDARQRSAAAQGTILNGGTQKALDRYGQDYASNEYSNLAQQKLGERQQQAQDYLQLAYGPAWQSNQAAVNQYGQLYNQYKDLTAANRASQNDYWQQQMDLLNAGLGAAKAGTPGTAGAQAG